MVQYARPKTVPAAATIYKHFTHALGKLYTAVAAGVP